MEQKFANALAIAKSKNDDYCGADGNTDPFKNFRFVEQLGICSIEKGILTRMCDKVARIATLLSNEANVKDESIHDTLSDLSNYSIILSNYLDSKKEK